MSYPADRSSNPLTWVIATILMIVIIGGVIIGGWQLGWWMRAQSVQKQNSINHNSQNYQDGLIAQERDRANGYDIATGGQQVTIRQQFCSVYGDIVSPPQDLIAAHSRICQ